MGVLSECIPPKEKGGNNRLVKPLHRQKEEKTKRGRNRQTDTGTEREREKTSEDKRQNNDKGEYTLDVFNKG